MTKRSLILVTLVLALVVTALPAMAQTRVVTMEDRQARPGAAVNVWGAAGVGGGLGDGTANALNYTWNCTFNAADVQLAPAPPLNGVVGNDKNISETITFTLLGGATRALVNCTLTVNGFPSSNSTTIDVVDGLPLPADAISDTPLENLAVDVNIAIVEGNAYMLQQQLADGCWDSATYSGFGSAKGATTGFTVWALENAGHLPTNDPNQDVYTDFVVQGLNCLQALGAAQASTFAANATVALEATAPATSDLNSNGQTWLNAASDTHGFNYSHPIATAAFIASLDTASYQTLVEDSIDYIGFAQSTVNGFGGFGQGGWDYNFGNTGGGSRSDYSINSWNWMTLEGGETTAFAINTPDWILEESELTLISHQTNPPDQPVGQPYGYSSDQPLLGHPNEGHATTCAGLSGLAAIEFENTIVPGTLIAGQPAPLNSIAARRTAALDWLGEKWTVNSGGGLGQGNRGNYYAMWTCCRALRLTEDALGVPTDSLTLMNGGVSFNWSTGEENASGNVPGPGAPREGYSPWLVRNQQPNGCWNDNTYLGTELETPLALLCLNPTVFGPPEPEDCPDEPDPRTQGYWHRQCLGVPASEGGIDPGRNGRGPSEPNNENFVPDLMDCADMRLEDLGFFGETVCSALDADPANDACEKALKQTTAVILNVCDGLIGNGCEVDVAAQGCSSDNVGDLLDELAGLIMGGDCNTAKNCANAINEGDGIVTPARGPELVGPSFDGGVDAPAGVRGERDGGRGKAAKPKAR